MSIPDEPYIWVGLHTIAALSLYVRFILELAEVLL